MSRRAGLGINDVRQRVRFTTVLMSTKRRERRTMARPLKSSAFIVAIVLASVSLLGTAGMATADPSVQERTSEGVSGLHFLSNVCGLPIAQEGILFVNSIAVGDDRFIQHISADITLSANGRIAFERPSFTAEIDVQSQTVTLEGTLVNISAPAEGVLLKDVGRIVRDVTTNDILALVGRWMILAGEFDEVCAYFAIEP